MKKTKIVPSKVAGKVGGKVAGEDKDNPVRQVRVALGLTQEQMAREMRCSINTLRRCEYENRLPVNEAVLEHFQRLAQRAGVEVAG